MKALSKIRNEAVHDTAGPGFTFSACTQGPKDRVSRLVRGSGGEFDANDPEQLRQAAWGVVVRVAVELVAIQPAVRAMNSIAAERRAARRSQ